jgi:hypothetical protein
MMISSSTKKPGSANVFFVKLTGGRGRFELFFSFFFSFFFVPAEETMGLNKKWCTYSIDQEVFFDNDILSRLPFATIIIMTVRR